MPRPTRTARVRCCPGMRQEFCWLPPVFHALRDGPAGSNGHSHAHALPRLESDPRGLVKLRLLDYDGKREKVVVDRRPGAVFPTRKDAVLEAVARCHTEQADALLASLVNRK